MWKTLGLCLIVVSVALNLAFGAVWLVHTARASASDTETTKPESAVWCPLHRELGVTESQWERIEPRLTAFQASAQALADEVQALRSEVLGLIAADEPDREAIRAKQDEVLATKAKIQALVVDHLLAEKQDLTVDQQARLFKTLRERTGCPADPPMSGPGMGRGVGKVLRGTSE
ncbi:MAG: periplasmic heavy metal sensor [Pirellulaceae bacterium]|nr:periplasmic heavy metal sensor [Pirellulaceae bacterium]